MQVETHAQQPIVVPLPDEAATLALGRVLAKRVSPGLRIYLSGNLGAGKTTLVRGLLHGLGYTGPVRSPSFTLVELYKISALYLYHYDFYRFVDPSEWLDAGFREQFFDTAICVVEWPEKAHGQLPPPDLAIGLEHAQTGRIAHMMAHTEAGQHCLPSALEY